MTTFSDLGLDPLLLKALDTEGYTSPTPIQAQAIPPILEGKDLLGTAQTGTGKTAAFALPILQRLAANRQPALRKGVRALILSPTRELATQIGDSFKTYGRHMGLTVAVVFGGVAHKPQRDALSRGVDILVATPGRLIDHMTERNVVLEGTEILVLDEADQMMDLGFIRPIRQIISKLSHRRQSLFFSATMPHEIGALAAELLKDPVRVSVAPVAKTADRVAQEVIFVEQQKKRALLVELFANPDLTRTIVFTRTKRGADKVAKYLEVAGVPVAAIHGNKSQNQRDAALRAFKAGKLRALIATDIAARGIDIDAVSHVVNFEIPNVPESYVHRIGRTARAGAEGIAISLVDHEERAYLRDIERLTRQQIPSKDRRGDATLVAAPESRERSSHSSNERSSRNDGERSARPSGARPSRYEGERRSRHEGERSGDRQDRPHRARSGDRNEAPRSDFRARGDGRPQGPRRDHPASGEHRASARSEARPEQASGERRFEERAGRPFEDRRPQSRDDRRPHGERGNGRPHHRSDSDRSGHSRSHDAHGGSRRTERNGEARHERNVDGGRRSEAEGHRHGEPRRERHGHGHGHGNGNGQGQHHDDRRSHSGEGRARHVSGHRDGEPGKAHTPRDHGTRSTGGSKTAKPDHGRRPAGNAAGLEGVHFLKKGSTTGSNRHRNGQAGPQANDRQKARFRPA